MPGYKEHLTAGTVVYTAGLFVVRHRCCSVSMAAELFACTLAGSLFPDIDITSKAQRSYYLLMGTIALWCLAMPYHGGIAFVLPALIMPPLVKHRGITHRWWFIALFTYSVWAVGVRFIPTWHETLTLDAWFFIAGAFSHLLLDLGPRRMWRR